jgi:hypothetical protein
VVGKYLMGATVKIGKLKAVVKLAKPTKLIFVIPARASVTSRGTFVVTTLGGSAKSKPKLKITLK